MTLESKQIKATVYEVTDDTEVGAGAPASLTGFAAQTVGFDGVADPYREFPDGALLLARNPAGSGARLYLIQRDSLSDKVAVLLTTGSATPSTGGIAGSTILFVVAPAALALPNSFANIADVLADATYLAATHAAILVLPGSYIETNPLPLKGFTAIYGLSGNDQNLTAAPVDIDVTASGGFTWTAGAGAVTFSNLRLVHGVGVTLLTASVFGSRINFFNVTTNGDDSPAISTSVSMPVDIRECYLSVALATNSLLLLNATSSAYIKRSTLFGQIDGGFMSLDDVDCNQVTCRSGVIDRCTIASSGAGLSAILYFPTGPLSVLNTSMSCDAAALAMIVDGVGVGGVLRTSNLVRPSTAPIDVPWVSDTIAQTSYTASAGSLVHKVTPDPGANFSLSPGVDEDGADVTVSGITAAMPNVPEDIAGRRYRVRNHSRSKYFELIPFNVAQTIDGQSGNVFLSPQEVLDLEVDKPSQWKRITNRANTYIVAKPWSLVPGSFPTFAKALLQITTDNGFNADVLTNGTPTIIVYPGTYIESVSILYQVNIIGLSGSAGGAIIDGNLTLVAAGPFPTGIANIKVQGTTSWTDGGNTAPFTAVNCTFDGSAALSTALSINATSMQTVRIKNCVLDTNVGSTCLLKTATTTAVLLIEDCRSNTNTVNIDIEGCAVGSLCSGCSFAGSVILKSNILFTNNLYSSYLGIGATLEFPARMDNNIFRTLAVTDYAVSTSGIAAGTLGRLAYTAPCAGVDPANETLGLGNFNPKKKDTFVALPQTAGTDVGLAIIIDIVPGTLTLQLSKRYPIGAVIWVVNDTAVIHTLSATPADTFGPLAIPSVTIPLPAYSTTIVAADGNGNRFWVK